MLASHMLEYLIQSFRLKPLADVRHRRRAGANGVPALVHKIFI